MKYLKTIPVILISALLIVSCSSKTSQNVTAKAQSSIDSVKALIPVKVLPLTKTKIARTVDYTATILPFEEVNVAPSSPGRIDKIYVEVGDRIARGQKLFLMDRTQLYQQKVQLANIAKDLARMDTLMRTGSIKQQQYDQLKTQYDVTKTNVDFMEENTLLTAPFVGIVTGKYFEDGEMFSGTPTTASGRSAVVTLMQVSPLKVSVNMSEQYYPLIKKGMKAEVTTDVYRGEMFNGTVYRIYPTVNSATRSFIVELGVPNKNDLLKPGMFVRVSMDLGEVETFVVPAAAVMLQEGTNIRYVFINDRGVAKRVEVLLGKRFDDLLEISAEPLKEGTSLIVEGQSKLLDGNKIEINQ